MRDALCAAASCMEQVTRKFTCFTSTKVQILTLYLYESTNTDANSPQPPRLRRYARAGRQLLCVALIRQQGIPEVIRPAANIILWGGVGGISKP